MFRYNQQKDISSSWWRRVGVVSMLLISLFVLAGCGSSDAPKEKILHYGTTAYGPAMENAGLNPHVSYQGWSAVRYGVGETLVRFTETMEVAPWLADSWQ